MNLITPMAATMSLTHCFHCLSKVLLSVRPVLVVGIALTLSSWLTTESFGQCVRFRFDEDEQVVAAHYGGRPGCMESLELHSYPKLVSLEILYHTTLDQSDLNQIAKISTLEELILGQEASLGETVRLDGTPHVLRALKQLDSLKVAVEGFDEREWTFVSDLPNLQSLEIDVASYFNAKACRLTDTFAKTLGSIESLRDLVLKGADEITDSFFSKLPERSANCEYLSLPDTEFTDDALQRIARNFPSLRKLEIRGNRLTDQGMEYLSQLRSLQELRVHSAALTSQSVRSAAKIGTLTELEFDVASAKVADIRLLSELPKLERVIFRRLAISDESLSCFARHPTLVSLFCDGSQLNQQKTIEFVRSLPNVGHISLGPPSSALQQAVSSEVKRIVQLRTADAR